MADPLVVIDDVSAHYGDIQALDGVSMDIGDGEFFALLGPSGCGKTTLLRALAGFETPSSGSITLGEDDLLAKPAHKRPVNMMFQSYALFPHLSVESNIAYGPARARLSKAETASRVAEVLNTVGLSGMGKRRPSQLSGGQRQRVALARAIVNRPRLLLLDEPLSALDKHVRAEMQLELKRLQHEVGITFVMVTHDQEEALTMADRVAVLDQGRVQQVATPHELYQSPANRFVAEFVGDSNLFAASSLGEAGDFVVVRPEEMRLVQGRGRIQGRITETQFGGGSTTVVIAPIDVRTVDDKPVLVKQHGFVDLPRDTEVGLEWDPATVVGLP